MTDKLTCRICSITYRNQLSFSFHIKSHGIMAKDYYDRYYKRPEEGVCQLAGCEKKTGFVSNTIGYRTFCSCSCLATNTMLVHGKIMHRPGMGAKLSAAIKGRSTRNKGKTYEEMYGYETAKRLKEQRAAMMRGRVVADSTRKKISLANSGRPCKEHLKRQFEVSMAGRHVSDETKKKQRLAMIANMQTKKRNGFSPNYNIKACKVFNELMSALNTNIQHAENGGEFYIKELGYWLDGYDKDNNVAYEYDEKKKNRTKKWAMHLKRQSEIENLLGCKFIRINEG
jgi:hypothetical protein